ncbi:SURF1 family protein [Actibacterium sp. 188UL27-1]|uniref:SURF1 family protein n=1 Tax=Actibacterium sp. 188UL27-1 TaxID=2786961 RepID=UPI00195D64B5|nr:SURF1 family protein [Actibacterium sp. 188UL27-1]MBM7066924.1 SURF1 family protein [Actibacterium sp. 188UL27-1]
MRFVIPLLIGLAGVGVLGWLGQWQLDRLAWKEGILAEIEQRIVAPPQAIPAKPDPEADRFLAIRATGTVLPEEVHVLVSTKQRGAGYRVISPFVTSYNRRVLVDRGYIPTTGKDVQRPKIETTIVGNLHWPEERDSFTPDDDVTGNIWFARDVTKLARHLNTDPVLIIVAETGEADQTVTPLPVSSAGIPNDHFGYAVTWFGLAAVWAGMTLLWLWRMRRRTA